MKSGPKVKSMEVRFFEQIIKGDPQECWPFKGGRDKNGYGSIKDEGQKSYRAHRYSLWYHKLKDLMTFEQFKTITLRVCHTCDNPPCCNPDHLFLGTNRDNTQDMIKKGRRLDNRGEGHGMARLTNKEVLDIYHSTELQKVLADRYGVTFQMISRIKRHKAWTHITCKPT